MEIFPFKGKASLDLSSLDRKTCPLSAEFQARAWFVPRGSKAHEAGATDTWNIVKLEKQEVCQKSLQNHDFFAAGMAINDILNFTI